MSGARRLLILGGAALAIWAMSYGLYYAVFVEHQTLDRIGGSLATFFAQAADRKLPEAEVSLNGYAAAEYVYVRQVDAHSHWIGLGMLLIILGAVFDQVRLGENIKTMLAAGLMIGSALFPLGVLLEASIPLGPARAVAVVGAGLVVVSLAGVAAGFARSG